MRRLAIALAAGLLIAAGHGAAVAAPEVYTLDPNHTQVGFSIRHIVSRVSGRFGTFTGEVTVDKDNPAASKVTAEIDAKSIDTGTQKRDDHLRSADFFDAEKFPKITFASKSVASSGKDKTTVSGDLTMHGVTKPVTLDVMWTGFAGPKAGFEAKTTVNRKDFGIVWNRVLDAGAAMLGDEVEITILVEANNQAAMKAAAEKAAAAKAAADKAAEEGKPAPPPPPPK